MYPPPLLFITASHSMPCSCLHSLPRLGLEKTQTYHHQQCLRSINALKVMFPNRKVKFLHRTCASPRPPAAVQVPGTSWGVDLQHVGGAVAAPHVHSHPVDGSYFPLGSQHYHGHWPETDQHAIKSNSCFFIPCNLSATLSVFKKPNNTIT